MGTLLIVGLGGDVLEARAQVGDCVLAGCLDRWRAEGERVRPLPRGDLQYFCHSEERARESGMREGAHPVTTVYPSRVEGATVSVVRRISVTGCSISLLDDLPVGVLSRDLPVTKLEEIDAADSDLLATVGGAGEEPGGDAEIAGYPVPVVAIVHVRQSREAAGKAFSHCRLSYHPTTFGGRASRHE